MHMKVNAILKHLLINVATGLDELLQLFEYGGFSLSYRLLSVDAESMTMWYG